MVWFNQATMFQTAELGFDTIKQAEEAGVSAQCDVEHWMKENVFPSNLE
jgi:hypothetical protein